MQLLKFLPITPGTTTGSGGAVSGKSPQTRACIAHIEMKTYLHNLLLDRVGRKWGTSASRVLSEWEVREVPVLVLVLGESADYWRLPATGHMDDNQVIAREPDRSSWFAFACLIAKIAKLRNWDWNSNWNWNWGLWATRAFIILTWIMISWFVYVIRRDAMLPHKSYDHRYEHQWGRASCS